MGEPARRGHDSERCALCSMALTSQRRICRGHQSISRTPAASFPWALLGRKRSDRRFASTTLIRGPALRMHLRMDAYYTRVLRVRASLMSQQSQGSSCLQMSLPPRCTAAGSHRFALVRAGSLFPKSKSLVKTAPPDRPAVLPSCRRCT